MVWMKPQLMKQCLKQDKSEIEPICGAGGVQIVGFRLRPCRIVTQQGRSSLQPFGIKGI
jgi:hypothetical protein